MKKAVRIITYMMAFAKRRKMITPIKTVFNI